MLLLSFVLLLINDSATGTIRKPSTRDFDVDNSRCFLLRNHVCSASVCKEHTNSSVVVYMRNNTFRRAYLFGYDEV